MATNLYVGNLAYGVTESDLQNLFDQHGTGRSKGFGFVEMDSGEQATATIAALNGQDVNGRALTVNEARLREERPSRGNGGYGGGRR